MIFQYQQIATPLLPPAPPPVVPELSWAPTYPDVVPYARSVLAPFLAAPPFFASALPLRVSQLPVEDVFQYGSVLTRTSQLPVETVWTYAIGIRQARVSQIAVEIIYPFGCFVFIPPLPNPCPAPNPDADGGPACTAPVLSGGS